MQKATQQVLEQAEPMAKEITRGIIAPGATEISKNAVPIAEEVSRCTASILVASCTSLFPHCILGLCLADKGGPSLPCCQHHLSNHALCGVYLSGRDESMHGWLLTCTKDVQWCWASCGQCCEAIRQAPWRLE